MPLVLFSREGKQGKTEQKRRKSYKGKGENWKRKGKSYQMKKGLFAFHFSKPLKFVLDLPKWEFSTGKKHFSSGKNREKWLCPLRKKILLRLCFLVVFVCFVVYLFVFVFGLFFFFVLFLFVCFFFYVKTVVIKWTFDWIEWNANLLHVYTIPAAESN